MTKDDYRAEIEEPLLQRIAADVELLRQAREVLEAMSNWDWDSWDFSNNPDWTIENQVGNDMASLRAVIAAIDERILQE